jgi:hypothetical protein
MICLLVSLHVISLHVFVVVVHPTTLFWFSITASSNA